MKKILITALALLACSSVNAAELAKYQPGNRLIDGSQLNKMVDVVNGLTGNGGTVSTGYFSANTTGTTGPTPLTGTVLQVVGANSATARIELDSYAGPAIFTTRRFDGTKAAPTALLSADQIGSFNFNGASTTLLSYGPASRMTSYATENWSSTAGGTKIVLSTTPNTTQTLTDAVTIGQDQTLTVVGAISGPSASVTGALTARSATATPAAASAVAALSFGSAGIGIYWGTGAPSISAVKGSLYIQTDGSSSSTRMFINNGTTTWIAITTAS